MAVRSSLLVACALIAAAWLPGVAGAQNAPATDGGAWTLLRCGRLLDVPGRPPRLDASVVVHGDRIVDVRAGLIGPEESGAPAGAVVRVIDLPEAFVLPGLIDCHTHITGEMGPDSRTAAVQDSDADTALQAAVYAERTLMAGFTTIRNVGSAGDAAFALRDAINAGIAVGPRMLCAGNGISATGGHGDVHGFRDDVLHLLSNFATGVADGPVECRQAVRRQVKRGADVIKLTATGGVLSETAAGTDQQLYDDELRAIVETAHMLGRKAAAHAHGTAGINAALRAGVDSIEHGSFLDDESVSLFRQTGAFLVPTLLAGDTVTQIASSEQNYFPPAVRDKALRVGPEITEAVRRAHAGGVRIAFGTDSGVSPHGQNAREFALLVAAGLTPAEAIATATVHAAELCGLSAQVGAIEPGKQADIIAVAGDPLADVTALETVTFVMRAGVVYKAP